MPGILTALRCHAAQVTAKTLWTFVELTDAHGNVGVGEATLPNPDPALDDHLVRYGERVVGQRVDDVDFDDARAAARTLPEFAAISALDQAIVDLLARSRGKSAADVLGGRRRDALVVYANVNRTTTVRTAAGFASAAGRAIADGFAAVKIAPFDGVELRGDFSHVDTAPLLDAAFARIAAVRAAIGDEARLMIDCHWRLDRRVAETVIDAIAAYRPYWLECPLPETPESLAALRALRSRANDRGIRLAGCETMSLLRGFMPFVRAGAYDVMMPDVKYVGGLCEMLALAELLATHGIECAPHNPSGPVSHAVSVQVAAAADVIGMLEVQHRETSYFDALVKGAAPAPADGHVRVPVTPGFGVRLDHALIASLDTVPKRWRHGGERYNR